MAKRETPLILIVEDYPDTRSLLSSLLRSKGYMVVEAGDGKEGVRQANRVKCMSNLRQIGQAMKIYAFDNGGQYPRTWYAEGSRPRFFKVWVRMNI